MRNRNWVGIDLDGTLLTTPPEPGKRFGEPIPERVKFVNNLLNMGIKVKIFTARIHPTCLDEYGDMYHSVYEAIQTICEGLFGRKLEVTYEKDLYCMAIIDDIAWNAPRNWNTFPHISLHEPLTMERREKLWKSMSESTGKPENAPLVNLTK
jgi:hypothetical protein